MTLKLLISSLTDSPLCVCYFLFFIYVIRGDRGDWADKKNREPRENRYDSNRDTQGREGGRSMRSIASEKPTPSRAASSSAVDTDDWGSSSSAKSTSAITPSASSSSSFSDSFNIAAWGDSLQSTSTRKDLGQDNKKKANVPQNSRNTEMQETDEGGSEDFDRLGLFFLNVEIVKGALYH